MTELTQVIHDIFGFNIPNSKYIADHFAANGFISLLPNLYQGISSLDGWPCTEFESEPEEGDKWDSWWTEITTDGYWTPFHLRVEACIRFLKEEKGCKACCLIGFCWGGIAIEQLSTKGLFVEAASVHGCHEGTANFLEAKARGCNITYHTVPEDECFAVDVQNALQQAGASVTVYPGMEHGFAVRGDFTGNLALREAADKCLTDVVTQFLKTSG